MASTAHPSFPQRPYSSTLHGKLPDRASNNNNANNNNNNINAFGATAHPATRETGRQGDRQDRDRAQRDAATGSGPQITDEQREEINEAFSLFDLDKDGRVDYHEFKVALKALGFDLPKSSILDLLTVHGVPPPPLAPPAQNQQNKPSRAQYPTPPSRLTLTLPAFQTIAAKLISERDPRDEILRAFGLFDTDEKGMITLEDLRRVARELGEGLEEDELVAMIEEFDLEGKGGVGQEEFIGICMG